MHIETLQPLSYQHQRARARSSSGFMPLCYRVQPEKILCMAPLRLQEYRGYEVLSCNLDSARRRRAAIEVQPASFLQKASFASCTKPSRSRKAAESFQVAGTLKYPRSKAAKASASASKVLGRIQGMSMDAARLLDHRSEADLKARG